MARHNRALHANALLDLTRPGAASVGLPSDASGPHWSPHERALYLLSSRHGGSAHVRQAVPGHGPATQVTHLPLDVQTKTVAADGHRLVASLAVFPQAEPPAVTRAWLDALAVW